jgi:antitoxin component of MazEF toxin-antitoxin module
LQVFIYLPAHVGTMAEMRVNRDKQNRVYVYLPAFLSNKFDLQNGDKVEVDTDGKNIF